MLRYGECIIIMVALPLELRHQDGCVGNYMAIWGPKMVGLPTKTPMALKIGKVHVGDSSFTVLLVT